MTSCQHCGCSEIEKDDARGVSVCTGCGTVLEDNIIVSDVQFEENSRGGSSAIGQFVSSDGISGSRLPGGFHAGYGNGKESRQVTLQNGREKIRRLAQQLSLNQHCIDTAFNFYKMAVNMRLTRGRRSSHVIAACVYLVCRTEQTHHMLLDFSDVLQVNVHELGKTYLKLVSEFHLKIPANDPCLYIVRFAQCLDFGDLTHEVTKTAARLVQRMKSDWIDTGRRPAGLCGAALLVAARLHDFNRTVEDVIKVVKVCEATLRKRLTEFGETPSSRLTVDEFININLEEQQDPPSFKAARRKAKMSQLEEGKFEEATKQISALQEKIEKALEERKQKLRGPYAKYAKEGEDVAELSDAEPNDEDLLAANFVTDETMSSIATLLSEDEQEVPSDNENEPDSATSDPEVNSPAPSTDTQLMPPPPSVERPKLQGVHPLGGLRPTAASLGLRDTIEECMKYVPKEVSQDEEGGDLDLSGIDDAEIDSYIMTAPEVQRKTVMWMKLNADYLEMMKEKEEREAKDREEGKIDKKKKRQPRKKNQICASTAGEAIEKMLQEKKISSKINYEVLRNLNPSSTSPAPSPTKPEAPSVEGSPKLARFNRTRKPSTPQTPTIKIDWRLKRSLSALRVPDPKKAKVEEQGGSGRTPALPVEVEENIEVPVKPTEILVEDGPIDYTEDREEEEEEDEEEEDEEEEATPSVVAMFGFGGPRDEFDDDYGDDYDEY